MTDPTNCFTSSVTLEENMDKLIIMGSREKVSDSLTEGPMDG